MSYTVSEVRGRRLHWLLTVTVAGRVARLSDEGVEVDDAETGTAYAYVGGLTSVSPPEVAVADAGELPTASASVEWLHPTDGGWVAFVEADPDLQDATAELALWAEGTDYRRRHVVVSGQLEVSGYGEPHEPVTATIALRLTEDRGRVPAPELVASSARWPRSAGTVILPDSSLDAAYPLVFGAPGFVGAGSEAIETQRGWRVVLVEISSADRNNSATSAVVLIHGEQAECIGSTVVLYNVATGRSASVSVTGTTDAAGQPVAIATVAAATLAIAEDDELWASAPSADAVGVLGVLARGAVGSAGDLARWLLARSTLPVDYGAMDGDLERLDLYRVAGSLAESRAPSEVLGEILGLLPCSWYAAPAGLALRVWPDASDPAILTVGPDYGCERDGPVEPGDPSEVYDAWRIEYDYDGPNGSPRRALSLVPDADPDDPTQVVNPYARRSNARGGLPPTRYALRWGPVLSAPWVSDAATAFALVSRRAQQTSRLLVRVAYRCPPEYQLVPAGSVVLWEDDRLSASRRARIVAIGYDLERPLLTLETLP